MAQVELAVAGAVADVAAAHFEEVSVSSPIGLPTSAEPFSLF